MTMYFYDAFMNRMAAPPLNLETPVHLKVSTLGAGHAKWGLEMSIAPYYSNFLVFKHLCIIFGQRCRIGGTILDLEHSTKHLDS
jgi:hypothetical protein